MSCGKINMFVLKSYYYTTGYAGRHLADLVCFGSDNYLGANPNTSMAKCSILKYQNAKILAKRKANLATIV